MAVLGLEVLQLVVSALRGGISIVNSGVAARQWRVGGWGRAADVVVLKTWTQESERDGKVRHAHEKAQ